MATEMTPRLGKGVKMVEMQEMKLTQVKMVEKLARAWLLRRGGLLVRRERGTT